MKKTFKNLVAGIVALTMALTICSCSDNKSEQTATSLETKTAITFAAVEESTTTTNVVEETTTTNVVKENDTTSTQTQTKATPTTKATTQKQTQAKQTTSVSDEFESDYDYDYDYDEYKEKRKDYYYNPDNYHYEEGHVSIRPKYVRYENGKLYAECFVTNGNNATISSVKVRDLRFMGIYGEICTKDFGKLDNLTIAPYSYTTWTFVFESDELIIKESPLWSLETSFHLTIKELGKGGEYETFACYA